MSNCITSNLCNTELTNHIEESCDDPIYSGIDAAGVIVNFDDVNIIRDTSNPHIITNITLKNSSRPAYRFIQERTNPFTGTNTAMEVGDFRNTFTATVAGFIPFDGYTASREVITPMANGRYIVIVRNQWRHMVDDNINNTQYQDNEWQVYGADKGLRASSLQQTRYENNDAWMVELQETGIRRASTFLLADEQRQEGDTLTACDIINALIQSGGGSSVE